jgi:hypothetical protein
VEPIVAYIAGDHEDFFFVWLPTQTIESYILLVLLDSLPGRRSRFPAVAMFGARNIDLFEEGFVRQLLFSRKGKELLLVHPLGGFKDLALCSLLNGLKNKKKMN